MKLDLDRLESGRSVLEIEGMWDLQWAEGRSTDAVLSGQLQVDNLGSRFLVGGALSAAGQAECGRCLEEFRLEWSVPVEIMVLRDPETDEGQDDSMVIHQKTGEVDLREALRESILLAYPQAQLCHQECEGLCPLCGINRNRAQCDCVEESHDPRWDALPD